jgi:hypothetical protein
LQNEGVQILYFSTNIKVIMQRGWGLTGHIANVGETRCAYTVLLTVPDGRIKLETDNRE